MGSGPTTQGLEREVTKLQASVEFLRESLGEYLGQLEMSVAGLSQEVEAAASEDPPCDLLGDACRCCRARASNPGLVSAGGG